MSTQSVPIERHVRSRDPETSWNAAKIEAESWSALQKSIVEILRTAGPLTDDELYQEYTRRSLPLRSPQRVRTARKELELAGVVTVSNVIGMSLMGNDSQKWEVAS